METDHSTGIFTNDIESSKKMVFGKAVEFLISNDLLKLKILVETFLKKIILLEKRKSSFP